MSKWCKCKCFLIGLLYENNEPSLTRFITLSAFLAFIAGSAYLLIAGKQWAHYETFAGLTAGGGVFGQLTNKFINNKFGSPTDQPYIKNNTGGTQQ